MLVLPPALVFFSGERVPCGVEASVCKVCIGCFGSDGWDGRWWCCTVTIVLVWGWMRGRSVRFLFFFLLFFLLIPAEVVLFIHWLGVIWAPFCSLQFIAHGCKRFCLPKFRALSIFSISQAQVKMHAFCIRRRLTIPQNLQTCKPKKKKKTRKTSSNNNNNKKN